MLKESTDKYPLQKEKPKDLLSNHEAIIVELKKDIDVSDDSNKDV